jgi:hypothetical protein
MIHESNEQCDELQHDLARQQREMACLRSELADAKRALPVERAFSDVQSRLRRLPEGFLPMAAFTDGQEIVIEGDPPDEESDAHCEYHNCDVMGCGLAHVILRTGHPFAKLLSSGSDTKPPEKD